MSEERPPDDVEKLLFEEKFLEGREQRYAAFAVFDQKLAKLGHQPNSGRKRRHHKCRS
jgi:hypothetical protein